MHQHEGIEVPGVRELDEGFEAFARRERPALLAFAWSLTGSFSAAEEIVQEVLTSAWRTWGTLDSYDRPGAWARRGVANRASNRRRSAHRERRALARVAAQRHDDLVAGADLGEGKVDTELWAAVRELPDRQAQAVALYYLEDLSVADIAEALGLAEGTVKAHLYRGRLAMARSLGLLADRADSEDATDEEDAR